jgi:hypothetical protein
MLDYSGITKDFLQGDAQPAEIGRGYFAVVFETEDPEIVMKIGENADIGYRVYLDYALEHQDNEHVPKIYYHHVTDDGTLVVFMERLKHNTNTTWFSLNDVGEANAIAEWMSYHHADIPGRVRLPKAHVQFIQQLDATFPKVRAFMSDLWRHCHTKAELDIHEANIMYRGHVPVLTDPYGESF